MKRTILLLLLCFVLAPPPAPVCLPQQTRTVYVWIHPARDPIPTQEQVVATPTSTPVPTPTPVVDSIPPPDISYNCDPRPGEICVNDMIQTPAEQIAQTVYLEDGGLDLGLAVDQIQLIDNRMKAVWNCNGGCGNKVWNSINADLQSWSVTTPESRARLALFLLSEKYTGTYATYAAFNAWNSAFPLQAIEANAVEAMYYHKILDAVNAWLQTGTEPTISVGHAVFYPLPALVTQPDIIFDFGSCGQEIDYLESHASAIRRIRTSQGECTIYYSNFSWGN
jgi:hypothetical protein